MFSGSRVKDRDAHSAAELLVEADRAADSRSVPSAKPQLSVPEISLDVVSVVAAVAVSFLLLLFDLSSGCTDQRSR